MTPEILSSIQAWIDGACEPVNPGGTATYGLVIKINDSTVFSEGKVVGSGKLMSNNVAEYSGLIAFLEWYGSTNYQEIPTIYSDSQLLVKQMSGEWQVHGGLYVPYYQQAWQLIRKHQVLPRFHWIPREQNTEADALSKQALIDAGVKLRIQRS